MLTLSDRTWMDPITENPRVGAVEVWEIMNLANDLHPIHLHLIQFQLLNRQAFDVSAYKAALAATDDRHPGPGPHPLSSGATPAASAGRSRLEGHRHPPDAVGHPHRGPMGAPGRSLAGPGSAAPGVNLYPFDPTRGKYVWHCHNLQHEDNEMMRPYVVSP